MKLLSFRFLEPPGETKIIFKYQIVREIARTPMLFSYGHPVGEQVRPRRLYGNLALYQKWKPPEATTCKPGLTQAFLQVEQRQFH